MLPGHLIGLHLAPRVRFEHPRDRVGLRGVRAADRHQEKIHGTTFGGRDLLDISEYIDLFATGGFKPFTLDQNKS